MIAAKKPRLLTLNEMSNHLDIDLTTSNGQVAHQNH